MRFARSAVTVVVFCIWSLAYGDSPAPPRSYGVRSADGKYLFVMLNRFDRNATEIPIRNSYGRTVDTVAARYPSSGLYKSGSLKPLWTVDWYADHVAVLPDGIHVIRHGPWASSLDDEAFTFFAKGKSIRSFRIREFVADEADVRRSV